MDLISFKVSVESGPVGMGAFTASWWVGGTFKDGYLLGGTGIIYEQKRVPLNGEASFDNVPAKGLLGIVAHAAPGYMFQNPVVLEQWMQALSGADYRVDLVNKTVAGIWIPYDPAADPEPVPAPDDPVPAPAPESGKKSRTWVVLALVVILGILVAMGRE